VKIKSSHIFKQVEEQILPHTDKHTDRMFVTLKIGLQVKWDIEIILILRLNLQDVTAAFSLYIELRI